MTSPSPRVCRIAWFAAIILAAHLEAQAAVGTVDGWTMHLKIDLDSGAGAKHVNLGSRVYATPHVSRMQFDTANAVAGGSVSQHVIVVDDSLHSLTTLDLTERSALVVPIRFPAVTDTAARFAKMPTIQLQDDGPGEMILGHPTHKYSIHTQYVIRTSIGGSPCLRTTDTDEHIWAATDLPRAEMARKFVRDASPSTFTAGPAVIDSLRSVQARRAKLFNGFVLKSILVSRHPLANGKVGTVTELLELTELTHGPISRSLLSVPADYKTVTMPAPSATPDALARKAKTRVDSMVAATSALERTCDPPSTGRS